MTSERQVVVIGDIILDQTTRVRVRGVSPENSAVVVAREESVGYSLGGAANVARGVATLGGTVLLMGANNDKRVDTLLDVNGVGISRQLVRPIRGRTPVKNRFVTRDGHYLLRVDAEDDAFGVPDADWATVGRWQREAVEQLLRGTQTEGTSYHPRPVICFVDYGKGFLTDEVVASFMRRAEQTHESFVFPIIVDPGRFGLWDKYESPRTIFRANLAQVMRHYEANKAGSGHLLQPYDSTFDPGDVWTPSNYTTVAERVRYNLAACKAVYAYCVVTLGPGGLLVFGKGRNHMLHIPAATTQAVDACGAGDTVTAAMAASLANEPGNCLSWESVTAAVHVASRAAGVAVRNRGVYAVTREDMGWYTEK